MSRKVLILRPEEAGLRTAALAVEKGLEPVVDPLFRIEGFEWRAASPDEYDALMFTSANAVKYAGPMLAKYANLPVLAVGEATAVAAKSAGLKVQIVGKGGAQALIDGLEPHKYKRILRLAGKHYTETRSSSNIVDIVVVYRSVALPLGLKARCALTDGCAILLHSVRAANILISEVARLSVDRSNCDIFALSNNVALAAGDGWKTVLAVPEPTDDALLSLVSVLCE